MDKSRKLILLCVISVLVIITGIVSFIGKKAEIKQLIFIGIDGLQVGEFRNLLAEGKLPNFKRLIESGGENSEAIITGHTRTETAPGNSELHTGLSASLTGVDKNTCGSVIPKGQTIFERLASFDSKISLGSIYGKQTCYIPLSVLSNAKTGISWWQEMTTYKNKKYITDNCADSVDVSSKALEFIKMHKNESYYLFVYFGATDCAGHTFGLPSSGYDEAVVNIDNGLGVLLEEVGSNPQRPQMIISGDHGWNTGTKGHGISNPETLKVVLLTNNHTLIDNKSPNFEKKQCDIAPTVLDYFGMKPGQYLDIINPGCESLMMATQ